MSIRLSKTQIASFCGHVVPLALLSDSDISQADIVWSSDSDAVAIRDFADGGPYSFRDGVLLVLHKIGSATVTAQLNGETYSCTVTVRERRKASPGEPMNWYIGDLHTHTSTIHKREPFAERTTGLIADYLEYIKEKNDIDFGVISDHGDVTNNRDFLRGFTDKEAM